MPSTFSLMMSTRRVASSLLTRKIPPCLLTSISQPAMVNLSSMRSLDAELAPPTTMPQLHIETMLERARQRLLHPTLAVASATHPPPSITVTMTPPTVTTKRQRLALGASESMPPPSRWAQSSAGAAAFSHAHWDPRNLESLASLSSLALTKDFPASELFILRDHSFPEMMMTWHS